MPQDGRVGYKKTQWICPFDIFTIHLFFLICCNTSKSIIDQELLCIIVVLDEICHPKPLHSQLLTGIGTVNILPVGIFIFDALMEMSCHDCSAPVSKVRTYNLVQNFN